MDWVSGEVPTRHVVVGPEGERLERRFVHRLYTATEWVGMLREAGFATIDCFSDWAGTKPPTPEARLIVRAQSTLE